MKGKWTGKVTGILILSAVFLVGICTVNVGEAYARYQDTTTAEVKFKVRTESSFQITCPTATTDSGLWSVNENGNHQMTFSVSKQGNVNDTWYQLSIAAVPGFEGGSTISLLVDNANGITRSYIGKAVAFATDSLLYQQMGPGYEYHFYDSQGEEVCWELEGGNSTQEFTVEISDGAPANLMEVIVTETQKPY